MSHAPSHRFPHRTCLWRALTALLALASGSASAQEASSLWRPVAERGLGAAPAMRRLPPAAHRTFALDRAALRSLLARAPREETSEAAFAPILMDLPWPDGTFKSFRIEESPIMEPELGARFPEIKTYRGQGVDDPSALLRFDWTPAGFHAIVLSAEGTVYVDPWAPGDTRNYVVFDRRHYQRADAKPFRCHVTGEDVVGSGEEDRPLAIQQVPHGATLRTYRLAVAATGEYTAFFGGTVPGAMAGITTTMNRVNALYQRDLAVRMLLVGNNSSVVYTDGATDPYTHAATVTLLCQNARNLDTVIGQANYDIGHVFDSDGGGLAVAGLCNNGNGCVPPGSHKGRAMTGSPFPQGDAFDVDYVAHEMGHQLGALHTFNGTTDGCGGGNRTAPSAYEPGSGSTIMAYAGICGAENLQLNSDAYFHARSQEEMISMITGTSCAAQSPTLNQPPVVDAGPNYTVPSQTPFTLTAVGSDPDGDSLTYAWEEYDLGAAAPPNTDDGTRPIFRSFLPTASPSRTFPKLSDILNNVSTFGELLPTTTRTMTFRVTARDNRASGGGTSSDDMALSVRSDSGPFAVTEPNTAAVLWPAGSMQTVTWSVMNTAAAPVSCANVKLSLSTNGGNTFPIVLAASTPNVGSQIVLVPGNVTAVARVKVEAVGNVFFDVSNANFTIAVTDLIFKDGFQ